MSPAELQRYLHEHIPLAAAMQVSVEHADGDDVRLSAPLAPNINHRETVFGGSASAVAILAAWSLVHQKLQAAGVDSRLVIQRNSMEYTQPIAERFFAQSFLAEPERWPLFLATLSRKGRARVRVGATLSAGGGTVGEFAGEFVALANRV